MQAKAIEIAKGDGHEKRFSWDIWDQDLKEKAPELLKSLRLQCKYPNIRHDEKPFLIEGSLFSEGLVQRVFALRNSIHLSISIDEVACCSFAL